MNENEAASRKPKFTLVQLMTAVVVLGVLSLIVNPNIVAMRIRAKEGATKANMHTLQLAAEDYGVQYDGTYARDARALLLWLPNRRRLVNAFTGKPTEPQGVQAPERAPASAVAGSIWYVPLADSTGTMVAYRIVGFGPKGALSYELSSGR